MRSLKMTGLHCVVLPDPKPGNLKEAGSDRRVMGREKHMRRTINLAFLLFAALNGFAFAQSNGTINGRVTDQAGALLPGATVNVTNVATGVTRTTTTNEEGLYNIPALQSGTYSLKVIMSGFASQERTGLELVTSTVLTQNFSLGVGSVAQEVEVQAEAPLVEISQSEVSGTLRVSEVQNLPMLNRNFTGLVTLVPGARPAPIINTTKAAMGNAISVGGRMGASVMVRVDGGEDRDDLIGGPLQNFTLEGIQEFKLLTHDYGAQYGRGGGGVLQLVTKSGTNQIHGSAFAFGRNDAMTAIDYFNAKSGNPKTPYDRVQAGGSLGGPLMKDRWFWFGAFERVQQNSVLTFVPSQHQQALLFAPFASPAGSVKPRPSVDLPLRDNMYTLKTDYHINEHHSLSVRWGHQLNSAPNDQIVFTPNQPDGAYNQQDRNQMWNMLGSETWIISNSAINQFTFQTHSYDEQIKLDPFGPTPVTTLATFPSFLTGRIRGTDQLFTQIKHNFGDDFTIQRGAHEVKFGGGFSFYPTTCICTNIPSYGGITFFDDPSTIINNTNGKYPQGFLTPGAVSSISIGTYAVGGPIGEGRPVGLKQFGSYFQDDWKVTPHLTLNLGLRYDLSVNFYDQSELPNNRFYQVLKAISSPYGVLPKTPSKDFAPRVGIAWNVGGSGRDVLRASYGVFRDQIYAAGTWQVALTSKPNLQITSTYVNTSVGEGQLASYVYGVSPLPAGPPPTPTQLPAGARTSASWISPTITDPYNQQTHLGYTHEFTSHTVFSADYTHILGLREFRQRQINPIENAWDPTDADQHIPWGTRRLAPVLGSVLGDPNLLGPVAVSTSDNRSRYDELIIHVEHRANNATFQANYTLARGLAYGGVLSGIQSSGAASTPFPQNQDQFLAPLEFGPGNQDERQRIVLSGVFNLPFGIQASPVLQAASARPYTLTAGTDLNKDGVNNDLYVDPATGKQVSVNSQRGVPTFNFDARVTKFFGLGNETRKLGLFAEFYNLTNRANFANQFNGNSLSKLFRQPIAFAPGIPTSRQLQLGARFLF